MHYAYDHIAKFEIDDWPLFICDYSNRDLKKNCDLKRCFELLQILIYSVISNGNQFCDN